MANKQIGHTIATLFALSTSWTVAASQTAAQVTHDGSLGNPTSYVADAAQINIAPTLGKRVCNTNNVCNLFHSFSQFNINTNQTVIFDGPTDIAKSSIHNILARVTGGDVSRIQGILDTLDMPNANFFLMNPNGVIFGPGARLDVAGSFAVTTANEIVLAEGAIFAATTDPIDCVLATASPVTFGFLDPTPRAVQVDQAQLNVPEGKTLSIIAGDVNITNSTLSAPGGRMNIVSAGSEGTINLDVNDLDTQVEFDPDTLRGNVAVSESSNVNIDGDGGGILAINSNDLIVSSSSITAFTTGLNQIHGQIAIDLTGDLLMSGSESIRVLTGDNGISVLIGNHGIQAGTLALGDGAHIHINAQNVEMVGASSIDVFSSAEGHAGNIDIHANDQVMLTGYRGITSTVANSGDGGHIHIHAQQEISIFGEFDPTGQSALSISSIVNPFSQATGTGGNITLHTNNFQVANFGPVAVTALTVGPGDSGNVTIEGPSDEETISANTVSIGDSQSFFPSTIAVVSAQFVPDVEPGASGDLVINTQSLELVHGGVINTSTSSSKNGGNITITATEIFLDNDEFISPIPNSAGGGGTAIAASAFSEGDAGNIDITTTQLEILNGAEITASTAGAGQGGNIDIDAQEILLDGHSQSILKPSNIAVVSRPSISGDVNNIGDAGSINIHGSNNTKLSITNQAVISTATRTTGLGGDISINVGQLIVDNQGLIESSSVGSDSLGTAFGKGGTISIAASRNIQLKNQSRITTSAAQSDAGNIAISAGTTIDLFNSDITAESSVDGGNITLIAPERVLLQNGTVTAEAQVNGGNIVIDPILVNLLGKSVISANAVHGSGGNITIFTNILGQSPQSRITASSQFGVSGTVNINSNLDLAGNLVILPITLLAATEVALQPHCAVQFADDASSFTIRSATGLPPEPNGWWPNFQPSDPGGKKRPSKNRSGDH